MVRLVGTRTLFKIKYRLILWLAITFFVAGLFAPAFANADPKPWFQETIDIKLGAVFAFHNTDLEVTESGGRKVDVDFENDLNVDSFTVEPNLEFRWRFTKNKKHRLMIGYFGFFRDGTENIGFELPLGGGVVIPVSTETKTEFNFNILDVSYGYSLLLDEKKIRSVRWTGFHLFGLHIQGRRCRRRQEGKDCRQHQISLSHRGCLL